MSDLTSCPSCRRPLVVPNPAKCACGAELGTGSRERTTSADPPVAEPQKKPLLTVAMQSEAQLALIEALLGTGAATVFDVSHDGRPLKDSDLGLPPGTLGRDMATAIGEPPEVFADVPHLVTLLTFNEKVEPATCAERVEIFVQLTALGRQAAASSATRALILHPSDRVLPPAEFLRMSEPRPDSPTAHLLVWLDLLGANGDMKTHGLNAFGLPEVVLSVGPKASEADAREAMDAVFTVAHQMLQQQAVPSDGATIGRPGGTTYELRSENAMIRVTALRPDKPSLWKRLFR